MLCGKGLDELQKAYIDNMFNLSDELLIGGKKYEFHEPDNEMLFINQRLRQMKTARTLYIPTIFQLAKHQKWRVFTKSPDNK